MLGAPCTQSSTRGFPALSELVQSCKWWESCSANRLSPKELSVCVSTASQQADMLLAQQCGEGGARPARLVETEQSDRLEELSVWTRSPRVNQAVCCPWVARSSLRQGNERRHPDEVLTCHCTTAEEGTPGVEIKSTSLGGLEGALCLWTLLLGNLWRTAGDSDRRKQIQ